MMFLKVIGLSFLLCTAVVVLRAALPTDVQVGQGRPHPTPLRQPEGTKERESEREMEEEKRREGRETVWRETEREREYGKQKE